MSSLEDRCCKVCRTYKPLDKFFRTNTHILKTCYECYRKQENVKDKNRATDEFKKKKARHTRKYTYKNKYNTTEEEVNNTLTLQDNKCANLACGVEISLTAPKELVKPAVVDHNHSTGQFRALLCNRCNTVLGHLEKNPHIIEGLKDYLTQYN